MPAGSRRIKASPWPTRPPITNPPSQSLDAFFNISIKSSSSPIIVEASIFETPSFFNFSYFSPTASSKKCPILSITVTVSDISFGC